MQKNILSVLLLLSCFYGFTQSAYYKHWGVKMDDFYPFENHGKSFMTDDARLFECSSISNQVRVSDLPNTESQVWASIGSDSNTSIMNIDFDEQGNVYVMGETTASEGFATASVYKSDFDWNLANQTNGSNGFVAKFDAQGELVWSTYAESHYIGGYQRKAITVDDNGNVYYTAAIANTEVIPDAPFQSTSNPEDYLSDENYFTPILVKLNSDGELVWRTFFSHHQTMIREIAVTQNKLVVYGQVMKQFPHEVDPTFFSTDGALIENPYQDGSNDLFRAFVNVFNFDGTRDWGTYLKDGYTSPSALKVLRTSGSNFYILHDNNTFPLHENPYMEVDDSDVVITKFGEEGTHYWSLPTQVSNFVVDDQQQIYLLGTTEETQGYATEDGYQPEKYNGMTNTDAFHHIVSSDGSELLYGTYYGYEGDEATSMIWPVTNGYISLEATQGNSSADNFVTQGEQLNESFAGGSYHGRVLTFFSDKPASSTVHKLANVTLYPNPVTDMLFIEHTDGFITSDSIEVYNALGQRILEKNNLSTHQVVSINTSTWRSGYYLVKIKSANKIGVYKVFKK